MNCIKETKKSVFYFKDTHYIVNTVNTKGTLGKGLALEFKIRYPEYAQDYEKHIDQITKGGDVFTFEKQKIISFATKQDWKFPSKMEWIVSGLENLKLEIERLKISKIALPLLGCSNGGLKSSEVIKQITESLKLIKCEVVICFATEDTNTDANKLNQIVNLSKTADGVKYLESILGKKPSINISLYLQKNKINLLREILKIKGLGERGYKKILDTDFSNTIQSTLL